MKIYLSLLFTLAGYCYPALTFSQIPEMYFADTGIVEKPFAKDPKVIHFKNAYFMYYSIPGKDMKNWHIGIATSKDLTNWKKIGEMNPGADYEKNGLCAPGAIVKDGKVHLFYQTYGNAKNDAICHAISSDGINFERNPTNPIFRPTGDWNCGRAIDAEVVKFKNRYFLYFATRDSSYKIQMQGVAATTINSSFNREEWTQLTDSSILKPELDWERSCIEAASCIQIGKKLFMFYAGGYNNDPQQVGVAVSDDGIQWKRISTKPFLANGKAGSWNESESGHPDIFRDKKGQTHLFFQGNNDRGRSWFISKRLVKWVNGLPVLLAE